MRAIISKKNLNYLQKFLYFFISNSFVFKGNSAYVFLNKKKTLENIALSVSYFKLFDSKLTKRRYILTIF
jgi:hypothetical protein